ncbi:hypothetical protein DAPPUDRAFT_271885 [Daphnia pulex]|uniref:Uncharacterized protein n=1 Tax=Daphnia pulex TaxID=6669 RepID=E9I2K0_DAPPU|nr:hypothetical protein DAPPUDRAFT_271885 [Daphnia pulex]|eukprot:EFX61779.1 hypothetical protein DAPPUDRAFT_271885 [Daphnia pulex]
MTERSKISDSNFAEGLSDDEMENDRSSPPLLARQAPQLGSPVLAPTYPSFYRLKAVGGGR